jgi:hypothetical protein
LVRSCAGLFRSSGWIQSDGSDLLLERPALRPPGTD